ncbi:MAG: hypothetical protein ACFFD4_15505 [Candidatus Odinarchaeota archaeon]
MMEIKYPEIIYCPSCKAEIRIDYSGKQFAKTSGLLNLTVEIPITGYSAQDARKNKQNLRYGSYGFIICQSCQTIIGNT